MDILKPLIALLAIVNPIGVLPFFIHFTEGFSREQRRRTIRVAAVSAFVVIAVSAIAGLRIIEFFGISLASFQVGGGMLLLLSSLQMLNAQPAESRTSDLAEGSDKVDAGDSIAIVPLTIPLLTGPATISTMVIYAEKTRHWWQIAMLVGYGVVIALAIWLAFGLAGRIAARHRPHRHQRHDAADGAAARGARGRGDVGRAGQALPGARRPAALTVADAATTTSSAAPAPPAACSPTG